MGASISSFFFRKPPRIFIFGLDNAGKTRLLYKMVEDGKARENVPSLSMEVLNVTISNSIYELWTICGGAKIQSLWPTYIEKDVFGIIYVINATERRRMAEVKSALDILLSSDGSQNLPILIYANKQDLPGCMSDSEIIEACDLKPSRNRNIKLQPCSAISGAGISEGLEWLVSTTPISQQSAPS